MATGSAATARGFTAMQYYLAHAKNNVHLVLASPQDVSAAAFRALVGRMLDDAPQMWLGESLARSAHVDTGHRDLDAVIDYARAPVQALGPGDLDALISAPLHDTGAPACRAICRAAPVADGRGVKSWIVLQTTHALMEGGDVTSILRGRGSVHVGRPVVEAGLTPLARAGIAALMPLALVVHMLSARCVTLDPADFAFRRVLVDRARVARRARRLGVGKRALLFGVVTHGLLQTPARQRPLNLAYSILPSARVRLYDDEFLNVRIDEFRVKGAEDPRLHVKRMSQALTARGPSPMATQALHRRLNMVHRRLHPRAPWIYPSRLFGYSPYDLVLSMLQPVRPDRYDPALAGARAFAGSSAGTTPVCIFAPARNEITLGLYLPPALRDRLPALVERLDAFGLAPEQWDVAEQSTAPGEILSRRAPR